MLYCIINWRKISHLWLILKLQRKLRKRFRKQKYHLLNQSIYLSAISLCTETWINIKKIGDIHNLIEFEYRLNSYKAFWKTTRFDSILQNTEQIKKTCHWRFTKLISFYYFFFYKCSHSNYFIYIYFFSITVIFCW